MWLIVLPPALGDAVLSLTVLARVEAERPGTEIFLSVSPTLVGLFGGIYGLARVFSYGELPIHLRESRFEWVVDISGFESHKLIGDELRSERIVFRRLRVWEEIVVRTEEEDRCFRDSFAMRLKSRGLSCDIPVWLEEAGPLLAIALEKDPCDGLNDRAGPMIALREGGGTDSMRWRADDKVILLPCGSWDAKRWPEINWIKLITRLKSTGLKVTVVIGPAERGYYTDLQSSGIEVCLPDSLKELVEVLSSESIIIGNDCGPLHLANALGKSCVAIFGPTNPYRWFWYHNERQRFLQTEYSYRRITTPDQRIERGETWDSWPDVEEVFGLTLDILRSSLSTKINPTS